MKRKISVRLTIQDWSDLVNFLIGDLHNMEETPVKTQMRNICNTINKTIAKN